MRRSDLFQHPRFLFLGTIIEPGVIEHRRQLCNLVIERSCECHFAPGLPNLEKTTPPKAPLYKLVSISSIRPRYSLAYPRQNGFRHPKREYIPCE